MTFFHDGYVCFVKKTFNGAHYGLLRSFSYTIWFVCVIIRKIIFFPISTSTHTLKKPNSDSIIISERNENCTIFFFPSSLMTMTIMYQHTQYEYYTQTHYVTCYRYTTTFPFLFGLLNVSLGAYKKFEMRNLSPTPSFCFSIDLIAFMYMV